jgi:hypothetical protein
MRPALALAAACATGACFTYRPLAEADPAAGHSVRADLSADGTEQLTRLLGPRVTQLDAKIASVQPDTIHLLVRVARTSEGLESYFKDDPVSLPRTAITSIMERRFSAGPTAAVGGLLVAGAIGAASALSGGDGNATPPGGGPAQPE